MPKLRIVGEDGAEQVFDFSEARVKIGRGRDNEIVLPDSQKGVSRTHAELRYENGHYVVVDLQSQNGTWINGRRVERAELPFGAELTIGAYRLTLLGERPAPARTTPRRTQPDPLDEIRPTERYDAAPVPAKAPEPAGAPRWAPAAAVVLILMIGAAAVVWVSGSRQREEGEAAAPGPSAGGPASNGTATAPPSPTASADRSEPADSSGDSPTRRSVDKAADGPRAGDGPRITRRPGESSEAWRNRAAALQTRYGYSKAALDRGDFAAAAGGFEAILLEEPGFLDAARLLVQAQAGLRGGARTLYQTGRKLDEAGDWMGALQKYEQARQIHATLPGLAESLQRVRSKLRAAGTAAFNEGRDHEAKGRLQEALKEYQKAVQWLPSDDPNWQLARARVQQLERKN